jgi:hypothetical protein
MDIKTSLIYFNIYGFALLIGFFIGKLLVMQFGFYIEDWGMGSDQFFVDWVNMEYSLTGGL